MRRKGKKHANMHPSRFLLGEISLGVLKTGKFRESVHRASNKIESLFAIFATNNDQIDFSKLNKVRYSTQSTQIRRVPLNSRHRLHSVVLSFLLGIACQNTQATPLEDQIKDVGILAERTNFAAKKAPSDHFELATMQVDIQPGSTISDILKKQSIVPNFSSYSIVYRLNPELKDVSDFKAGSKATVPIVKTSISNLQNYEFKLAIDEAEQRKITKQLSRLTKLRVKLEEQSFRIPSSAQFIDTTNECSSLFGDLSLKMFGDSGTQPVPKSVARQMVAEMEAVNSTAEKVLAARKVETSDIQELNEINLDLKNKASQISAKLKGPGEPPTGLKTCKVTVLLKSSSDTELKNISDRIYYSPYCLYKRGYKEAFSQTGSPVVEQIPFADYYFWSQKNPSTPSSDATPVSLCTVERMINIIVKDGVQK